MLTLRKVKGESMSPSFKNGDLLLCMKAWDLHEGNVIIAKDPRDNKEIVKRIYTIQDNLFDIRGDNEEYSTDSRTFGMLQRDKIQWKVIGKL